MLAVFVLTVTSLVRISEVKKYYIIKYKWRESSWLKKVSSYDYTYGITVKESLKMCEKHKISKLIK